jgi:hypothetical protein
MSYEMPRLTIILKTAVFEPLIDAFDWLFARFMDKQVQLTSSCIKAVDVQI